MLFVLVYRNQKHRWRTEQKSGSSGLLSILLEISISMCNYAVAKKIEAISFYTECTSRSNQLQWPFKCCSTFLAQAHPFNIHNCHKLTFLSMINTYTDCKNRALIHILALYMHSTMHTSRLVFSIFTSKCFLILVLSYIQAHCYSGALRHGAFSFLHKIHKVHKNVSLNP